VYYFPGQVGQGKIKWEDAAAHALFRDTVLGNWPKDEAGWAKTLSREEEAVYVEGLVAEERHAVSGLGGSQKAEVAWLDKHGIPYKEVDVIDFIDEPTENRVKNSQKVTQVHPVHEEAGHETTEVVSLVEPAAEDATSGERTGASTSATAVSNEVINEAIEEERAVTQTEDHVWRHELQQGQAREQPARKGGSGSSMQGASRKEQQPRSASFRRSSLAAAANDQEL
jgi:hypothetical protein